MTSPYDEDSDAEVVASKDAVSPVGRTVGVRHSRSMARPSARPRMLAGSNKMLVPVPVLMLL